MPPKVKYRVRCEGSRLSTTIPQKIALGMGLVDDKGALTSNTVRFSLGYDDEGPYGIIRVA